LTAVSFGRYHKKVSVFMTIFWGIPPSGVDIPIILKQLMNRAPPVGTIAEQRRFRTDMIDLLLLMTGGFHSHGCTIAGWFINVYFMENPYIYIDTNG
jgi:hypothetical protein